MKDKLINVTISQNKYIIAASIIFSKILESCLFGSSSFATKYRTFVQKIFYDYGYRNSCPYTICFYNRFSLHLSPVKYRFGITDGDITILFFEIKQINQRKILLRSKDNPLNHIRRFTIRHRLILRWII